MEYSKNDIAIIGMDLRFPGADSVDEFWELLKNERSGIRSFSDQELLDLGVKSSDLIKESFVKYGAVIENIEDWDNKYFGFNPKSASILDPQQRLLLEGAVKVIQNAGYSIKNISDDLAIYVTVANNDYAKKFSDQGNLTDKYLAFTSNDNDFAASRIAYALNAKGPCMTINTACSSSLTCIYQAVKSLREGDCKVALAGGASILFPQGGYEYDSNLIFSPDGKCRPFDKKSEGTVFGNGVGLVLLKKLSEAIEDKDHIYSIIKGGALTNDGSLKTSYFAPGLDGQSKTINKALENAKVNPETISYVEAHGTATKLGDPIEIEALSEAYSNWTNKKQFAYIGSVKSNIGHLNTASGIAGFIKAILSLYHKQIPGTINFETESNEIDFQNTPFKVCKNTTNWEKLNNVPRRAGVSSFGIGGSNVHLILEEAPIYVYPAPIEEAGVFPISERSPRALETLKKGILQILKSNEKLNLEDFAFTLQESRSHDECRKVFKASTINELISNIELDSEANANAELKKWKEGSSIDWKQFRKGSSYRRLAIPVDTFEKVKLSISDFIISDSEESECTSLFNIQKRQSEVKLISIYKATLEPNSAFLRDHNRIFPAAAYIQLANELLRVHEGFEGHFSIVDFSWEKFIKVNEHEVFELLISYNVQTSQLVFYSEEEVYARCSVSRNKNSNVLVDKSPYPNKIEHNNIYELFNNKGFEFGSSFRVIEQIKFNDKRSSGTAFIASNKALIQLLDSIFQISLFSIEEFTKDEYPYIPYGLKSIWYELDKTSKVEVATELVNSSKETYKINISFFDINSGKLLGEIIEMTFLRVTSFNNEFSGKTNAQVRNISNVSIVDSVEDLLIKVISNELGYSQDNIDLEEDLDKLGLDSVMLVNVVNQLEKTFTKVPKTLFFEHRNLKEIIEYLIDEYPDITSKISKSQNIDNKSESQKPTKTTIEMNENELSLNQEETIELNNTDPNDVAIIGIHGMYPESENLNEYWENIKKGKDCITEIPEDRWNESNFYNEDVNNPKTSYSKWGGFIKNMQYFDPLFFKIPPKEIEVVDPQERLFLESCWLAIENAGYTPKNLVGEDRMAGVYVGVMWAHYQLFSADEKQRLNADLTNTSAFWSIANRVSYTFDFAGASMAVDTACSASLSALHVACNSLIAGENEVAVVGGVNLNIHPLKYYLLSERRFAAQDGRCRSFGVGGTGYVPGEGVGTVVIKPLKKALEDNDHIHGVIKGTSINHGGKSNGYSVPSVKAQGKVIEQALKRSKVRPDEITYIEAHGTGTALGDPIEINGLRRAYQTDSKEYGRSIPIGSVKSNIGHLESAAGVAALHKVLLQLEHKELVPSIHSDTLNPNIEFHETPFVVQKNLEPWKLPKNIERHTVGISSFGAGGSNAHVIIQEAPKRPIETSKGRDVVINISAREKETLVKYASEIRLHCESNPGLNLESLAFTLQTGRIEMDHRISFSAASIKDIITELKAFEQERMSKYFYKKLARKSQIPSNDEVLQVIGNYSAERLALLWSQGAKIDWMLLYVDTTPRRVPIPGYPFNKRRLWFKEVEKESVQITPNKTVVQDPEENIEKIPIEYTEAEQPMKAMDETFVSYLELDLKKVEIESNKAPRESTLVLINVHEQFKNRIAGNFKNVLDVEGEIDLLNWKKITESIQKGEALDVVVNTKYLLEKYPQSQELLNSFFRMLKNIILDTRKAKLSLVVIGENISSSDIPIFRALGSMFKVANKEVSSARFRLIEMDEAAIELEQVLLQELNCSVKDRKVEAVYNSVGRHEYIANGLNRDRNAKSIEISSQGAYVITGGMGAIGIVSAEYLINRGASKVVLLGRRVLENLSESDKSFLNKYPSKLTYLSFDMNDDFKKVVNEIESSFGSIKGLIHAAGVIRDKMISMKSNEDFDTVISPKINGVLNIDRAISKSSLDFVIYCSSVSAVEGQMGQVDYTPANRFMDEYAALRNKQQSSTAYISINWPYWAEGGMRLPDAIIEMMHKSGIFGITNQEGVNVLESALKWRAENIIVFKHKGKGANLFFNDNHLLLPDAKMKEVVENQIDANVLAKTQQSDSNEQIIDTLRLKILNLFQQLLGLERHEIDTNTDIEEYGIDSVGIMKLSTEMENLLENFSVSTFFECRTIEEILAKINEEIQDGNFTYIREFETTHGNQINSANEIPSTKIQSTEYQMPSNSLLTLKIDRVKGILVSTLSNLIGIESKDIDTSIDLEEYGVDSVMIMKVTSELEKVIEDFSVSVFFECKSIDDVVQKLSDELNEGTVRISIGDNEIAEIDSKGPAIAGNEIDEDNSPIVSHQDELEGIKQFIVGFLSETLGLSEKDLDTSMDLQEFGIDSVVLMKLSTELEHRIDNFAVSIFFECSSIDDVINKLKAELNEGNLSIIELKEPLGDLNKLENTYSEAERFDSENYFDVLNKQESQSEVILNCLIRHDKPQVAHHIIQNKVTLPGAAYIDMVVKGFEKAFGEQASMIRNIAWFSPIFFEGKDQHGAVKLNQARDKWKFSVETKGINAKGEVKAEKLGEGLSVGPVNQILNRFENQIKKEVVYNWFEDHQFTYKEEYQVIEKVHVGANSLLGVLKNKRGGLNPMILDGTFQSIVGFSVNATGNIGELWVPFFIEKLNIFNQNIPQDVFSFIERDTSNKDASIQKFNIYLIDAEGKVYLQIKNFTLKSFSPPNAKKANSSTINEELQKVQHKEKQSSFEEKRKEPEPIAVISAACKIPGANSPQEFWDNLVEEKDLIKEIPEDRWDYKPFYDPEKGKLGKIYSKWGGFMENVDAFDPDFFKIKEQDAHSLDPQQRILLELTQHLFDQAGYEKTEIANSNTGVIIGAAAGMWRDVLDQVSEDHKRNIVVNTIQNMIAARIADFYDLKGTAYTMDTACSSSLVAVHEACQKLRSGECDMVVAGGITLLLSENGHKGFCGAQVLSENGRCAVFDQNADGIVLGEGAGLVLLKPYSKAIKDGDQIMGVIRGSAVNNDGKTMGLTTPNMSMQEDVLEKAFKNAHVSPATINYMEAHGTGTLLGDPIEVKAATKFFSKYTDEKQFCGIGSVKSNVGHLLHASGVIGLIKVMMSMKNNLIPATLHCKSPHSRFEFHKSSFFPSTKKREWKEGKDGAPRRAAISSFGFGGTNCHAVLEEVDPAYVPMRKSKALTKFKKRVFWPGKPVVAVEQKESNSMLNSMPDELINVPVRIVNESVPISPEMGKILTREDILQQLKNGKITVETALELEGQIA